MPATNNVLFTAFAPALLGFVAAWFMWQSAGRALPPRGLPQQRRAGVHLLPQKLGSGPSALLGVVANPLRHGLAAARGLEPRIRQPAD